MAKKKINSRKATPEKATMIKIAEKVGELAGRIMNEKDHLAEIAGNAIESVKSTMKNITAKKKLAVKKAAKKAIRKTVKPVSKKIPGATVKKAIKKATKKVAKKSNAKKARL